MSDEATPQAVVPPSTEDLTTRPEMEGTQTKDAVALKEVEKVHVAGDNAKSVATSEPATATRSDIDSMIALFLHVSFAQLSC